MSLSAEIHKNFDSFSLDVSFETDQECLGILGASGCGKSMTLKCIAGIITPDSGRIVLNDRILYDSDRRINLPPRERKTGYLFQNYALFPRMTVWQNIGIGIRGEKAQRKERIIAGLIERFHLEGLEERFPPQLSGGQQQRVALARILAYEPEILMLDEPFSALDSFLKEQLQFEVKKVLEGYSGDVLMVTHSRDEVYQFCSSVVVMEQGRKVEQGKTRELFSQPKTLTTARLSGCKNFSSARKISSYNLYAEDGNTELTSGCPVPDDVRAVGIRAHDFIPCDGTEGVNVFRGEMVDVSEGPFEISARMTVNGNDKSQESRYVWWKTERTEWDQRWKSGFPSAFRVDPRKIMPLIS